MTRQHVLVFGCRASVDVSCRGNWGITAAPAIRQRLASGVMVTATCNGWIQFKSSAALRPRRPCARLGTGSPGRPPRLSHSSRALTSSSSSVLLYVHRDHTDYYSDRDGEPRTAISIFTQLLSSEDKEFKFSVALRPERPTEFWGRRAQYGHLDFHTVPKLRRAVRVQCCFTSTQIIRTITGRPPPLSHSSRSLTVDCQCSSGV